MKYSVLSNCFSQHQKAALVLSSVECTFRVLKLALQKDKQFKVEIINYTL